MRIDLVFPALPPALDGIGDYTACLASALRANASVRIHTAEDRPDPIDGVRILQSFSMGSRRGVNSLEAAVLNDPPDWLVVQFNQFSYGRWGLNPFLPRILKRIQRKSSTRLAVMAHEDFVPVTSLKFAVMTTWQRAQFYALGRNADVFFFSIEPWVKRYAWRFGGTPVYHLPVGSNIPESDLPVEMAKRRALVREGAFVVGVFGTLGASRMTDWIAEAAKRIEAKVAGTTVLYVGPDGEIARRAFNGTPLLCAGALPAREVAHHMRAMDMHLAPFIDGVSTRRGSFLAGLRNGVPSVGTRGPLTDAMVEAEDNRSFVLAEINNKTAFLDAAERLAGDAAARAKLAENGKSFFDEHFAWDVIARRMLELLERHC